MLRSRRVLGAAFALLLVLVLVLVWAGGASAQTGASRIAAARSAMEAGVAAANSGDLQKARVEFARAVELEPKIAEGHAALGSVLLALGEVKRAAEELRTAHRLAPADAAVDVNLATAESLAGNYAESVRLFREALAARRAPEFAERESVAYAAALAQTGEATQAETVLRNALAARPDSAQLNDMLGVLLARRGAMEDALSCFERAVVADGSVPDAQMHLGTALIALNRPQEALPHLQSAAAAHPQDFNTKLQLGRALSSLHRDAEALQALREAARLRTAETSSDAVYSLALALQASGDPAGALPLFEAAVRGNVTSAALINFALARVQTGDATGALPLYARALAVGPDSSTLRQDYGVAYLQQADLDDAIAQFRKGLELDANSASLHYNLGLALKLKDDLAAAVPEFERAAQIDPSLPDPPYTLGILYMQQGRFAESAAQFRRALSLQPNNGDAWALLGSVLREAGDAPGAVEALRRAIVLQPEQPSLHIQLAALQLQAGDKEGAAAERKVAADLSRKAVGRQRATFALRSGRALLAEGKLQDAITQLTVATQADASMSEPHRLLADAYERQGRAGEAALERQKAASLEAANPPPGTPVQ